MFLIDTHGKKAVSLDKSTFAELKLSERYDLQEWIADNPNILGENLLIIQKEFAGFSEAQPRMHQPKFPSSLMIRITRASN